MYEKEIIFFIVKFNRRELNEWLFYEVVILLFVLLEVKDQFQGDSFGYSIMDDEVNSINMRKSHPDFAIKHSSGDLHSRLKTRKLLGVGETDDGDVHRSKLSQILGHSDQLYIRLPSGLRIWQILLAIIFSVMSIWALVFPSHYFVSMYELDGKSYTFPIRLYATALVCIAVMYWSTIQASDRDIIRLVLLSSIVFFALQTLVLMTSWLPWQISGVSLLSPVLTLSTWLLVISISSYFYWITYREGKSKDIRYYR